MHWPRKNFFRNIINLTLRVNQKRFQIQCHFQNGIKLENLPKSRPFLAFLISATHTRLSIAMVSDELNRVSDPISIDFMMEDDAKVTVFSTVNSANICSPISLISKYAVVDDLWCLYS